LEAATNAAIGAAFQVTRRDLGTLGGRESRAIGISQNGIVVGWSLNRAGQKRAFKWTAAGGMRTLSTLAPGRPCQAHHANRRGQVVGQCTSAQGQLRAVLWSPTGQIRNLGPLLGGDRSSAADINENGMVVGYSTVIFNNRRAFHSFRWTPNGGMVDIGGLGYGNDGEWNDAFATRLNNSGQVAGYGFQCCNVNETAIRWSASNVIQGIPDGLGGGFSHGRGINNLGHVVGEGDTTQPCGVDNVLAFRWTPAGGPQTLFPPFRCNEFRSGSSVAYAINDQGLVVGSGSTSTSTHAMVWNTANAVQDLGVLQGGTFSHANDINNANQAVRYSSTSTGAVHAALWTLR
jgi:probable HAF family extracellular repeat protein